MRPILRLELDNANINHGDVSWFAAPRRLAIKSGEYGEISRDGSLKTRPCYSANLMLKVSQPAAEGWARGNGITVDQAERLSTDKGEWLFIVLKLKAKPLTNYWLVWWQCTGKTAYPKLMRWGDKETHFCASSAYCYFIIG